MNQALEDIALDKDGNPRAPTKRRRAPQKKNNVPDTEIPDLQDISDSDDDDFGDDLDSDSDSDVDMDMDIDNEEVFHFFILSQYF